MTSPRVAVVVAVTDPCPSLPEGARRFAAEVRGRGEVVLVDGTREGLPPFDDPAVRVLPRPPGRLAPELWRDGFRASEAPLVAFTTASMVPHPGWLDALLGRLDATGAAAVGGPIAPGEGLPATDRAVFLLRYANYLPPLPATISPQPPGDNALYRRDRLQGLDELIEGGFWEAEVHRRLLDRGEVLTTADGALVTYHGGARLGATSEQRFRHGRRYGAARGAGMSARQRLARAAASPAVPLVLGGRVAAALRSRGEPVGRWLAAVPGLSVLAACWAAGEAVGLLGASDSHSRLIESRPRPADPNLHRDQEGERVGVGK